MSSNAAEAERVAQENERAAQPGRPESAANVTVTVPEVQVHVHFQDAPLPGPWGRDGTPANLRAAVFSVKAGKVSRVTGTVEDDRGSRFPKTLDFMALPQRVRQEVADRYAEQIRAAAETRVEVV